MNTRGWGPVAAFALALGGLGMGTVFASPPSLAQAVVGDVDALRADLADGNGATCVPGTVYEISAPLVVSTSIDMSGCTVRAVPGAGFNLLQNAAVTTGVRDHDIRVTGGLWERGANGAGAVGSDLHNLFFRHVDGLTVEDVRVTSAGGKYAVAIGDATLVTVNGVVCGCFSDGVHVTGPASDVDIRNIKGTTGDDQVAFTGRDYPMYDDVRGDISNVTVDGVYASNSLAALKVVGGTGTAVRNMRVTGLFGTTRIRPVAIISDTTGTTIADGITVDGVYAQATDPAWSVIWLRGVVSTDITIKDVRLLHPVTSNPMVLLDRDTNIASLNLEGWLMTPAAVTTANLVGVYGTAKVGALRISRVRVPSTWPGLMLQVGSTTASVASSVVSDVYVTPATTAKRK